MTAKDPERQVLVASASGA